MTTHCRSDSGKCSFTPMVGRATLTIVRSTMVMKYATTSRAKARQRRTTGSETTLRSVWVRREARRLRRERDPPSILSGV